VVTFERLSRYTVKMTLEGKFVGYLDHGFRTQTTGLTRRRVDWWETRINGTELRAPTLLKAKNMVKRALLSVDK
jgi:hypothetical protein